MRAHRDNLEVMEPAMKETTPFRDRFEAGTLLGRRVAGAVSDRDLIVLGLPNGGVPVALKVAEALEAPLDVCPVRKLGVPGLQELAMGAVSGDARVLNHELI